MVVCLPYLGEGALGRVGIGGGRAGTRSARAEFASQRGITVVASRTQLAASAGGVVLKFVLFTHLLNHVGLL